MLVYEQLNFENIKQIESSDGSSMIFSIKIPCDELCEMHDRLMEVVGFQLIVDEVEVE